MTNEELVQLYQDGDKEALQELLQQNKGFIYKVAKKFFVARDNALLIVRLNYGFHDGACHSLRDIGDVLGIPFSQVREIEKKAFREIRKSKWARMRRAENRTYRKEHSYDRGSTTQCFFDALDQELKELLHKVR